MPGRLNYRRKGAGTAHSATPMIIITAMPKAQPRKNAGARDGTFTDSTPC